MLNVNNTGTKNVSVTKYTEFLREKKETLHRVLKKLVFVFVE
jgi:hypothetical protein